jgi:hypothetical protein
MCLSVNRKWFFTLLICKIRNIIHTYMYYKLLKSFLTQNTWVEEIVLLRSKYEILTISFQYNFKLVSPCVMINYCSTFSSVFAMSTFRAKANNMNSDSTILKSWNRSSNSFHSKRMFLKCSWMLPGKTDSSEFLCGKWARYTPLK